MNAARLMFRHPMKNGLTLEFWDHSHPVAGDRRVVVLETRVAIPIRADTLPPDLQAHAPKVANALGDEVFFSQREERNFIAAAEVASVLKDMQDRMIALAPGYFGHADFAGKFIRKTYVAYLANQNKPSLEI
ncbi:MAG TPA: hypothetical protein VE082_06395 [Desulfobaccales bacterium]|nr:hypothetical protein [Desulfobaccales bacterium]